VNTVSTEALVSDGEVTTGDLAERLFVAGLGALELLSVRLGVELGLYAALAQGGPATSGGLALRAGVHERYAREWLEQQTVASILVVEDPAAVANRRRYSLPESHAEVLLEVESLRYSVPMSEFLVSFASVHDALAAAYRTGGGIPYTQYGTAMRAGQAAFNRPVFTQLLTQEWLPQALPDLHARLRAEPPARVADVGCGLGWSAMALARAYPLIAVDGIDSDDASVAEARQAAAGLGLDDRVSFTVHNVATPAPTSTYDAAFIFEALHDMAQPVAALTAARRMLKAGGVVVVMDERVADEFAGPGDEVERFMYAASVLHCLPVGLAEQPSAATGTVMRRSTLERYAAEAGFSSVVVLPVEHDFFRLYRLEV
jgi:2-polyprenyl-3-methyl-5-hydroxy-6-metoxy-1,4-benzoquinol methylase